jgi:hypothetical protein
VISSRCSRGAAAAWSLAAAAAAAATKHGASQLMYDNAGRVVGYSHQPVQVCPDYLAAPPAGYVDAPPPGYGDAPRPGNVAPRRKPPAKQQQVQSKEDGKQQVQAKQDSKQQVEPKDRE